jgi:very-short-patch-repair endonuclease
MLVVSRNLQNTIRLQHGVVTARQLLEDGISASRIRRLVTTGALVRVHKGVYRVGVTPDSIESRSVAACLADDRVVISHLTAGRFHGLRRIVDDELVHVCVLADRVPLRSGVVTHRTKVLPPSDVETWGHGIRLTTLLRTVFDLASILGDLDIESIIEQGIDRRRIDVPQLHETGRRLCAPGRTGSARFTRVVGSRPAWIKPADSHLEVMVWRALLRAGISGLVRQHEVVLPDGRLVYLDLADPVCRWGLEIDHVTWHGGRVDAQDDKRRDRALRRCGWEIERVTDTEIRNELEMLVIELVASHRDRWRAIAA